MIASNGLKVKWWEGIGHVRNARLPTQIGKDIDGDGLLDVRQLARAALGCLKASDTLRELYKEPRPEYRKYL